MRMRKEDGPKCFYCDKRITKSREKHVTGIDRPGFFRRETHSAAVWRGYGWPNTCGEHSAQNADTDPPFFCSLRCGMKFGRAFVLAGQRLYGKTGGYRP